MANRQTAQCSVGPVDEAHNGGASSLSSSSSRISRSARVASSRSGSDLSVSIRARIRARIASTRSSIFGMRLTTFYAQSLPLGFGTSSSIGAPPSLEPTEETIDSLEVLESGRDPCGSALDPQQNPGFLS
jgi:hypothetical protein